MASVGEEDGLVRRFWQAVGQRLGTRLIHASNAILARVERPGTDSDQPARHDSGACRVACFSPYATWEMVSQWEFTVLRGLARRGCDTRLLLCDAVSPMCDLVWADKSASFDRCVVCQNRATGAAIAHAGCRRWLESVRPDVLWLFNGRLSLTRVALEAARGLGIRVICHERGIMRNSLRLWRNRTIRCQLRSRC